ncbi:acyl-CoA dehydrogenase family protein [Streptomyces sioyaensis]|uniref:acyl-CoA dehydrogenase family protein n=1 Tax=Streptomyces sioyaensis TaxID=67364 RepID=UPI00379DF954
MTTTEPAVTPSTEATAPLRSPERDALLDSVERIRNIVLKDAQNAERERTLPRDTLAAFRAEGLFRMGAPRVLGGLETDPITQVEVFEAVARLDGSAAWSLMIGAQGVGTLGSTASDEACQEIFATNWPHTAGQIHGRSTVERVQGGYVFTGQWSFASGIRHATWVSFDARYPDENAPGGQGMIIGIAPASDVNLVDDWHVAGLSGSGSCSFSVDHLFVPEHRTYNFPPRQLRGGPKYMIPEFAFSGMIGLMAGIARRSLDDIADLARTKRRPFSTGTVADRPHVQHTLGELDTELKAARAYSLQLLSDIWAICARGEIPPMEQRGAFSAAMTHLMEVGVKVTNTALRFGGSGAVYLTNSLQRNARDAMVAAQHITVSEMHYEAHGRTLLGFQEEGHPRG